MQNIRISATEVDQYRDYLADIITLDTLLLRLRKQEPPTRRMMAGSAWHEIMEHVLPMEADMVERNGFKFKIDCDLEMLLPPIRELKGVMEYEIDGYTVTVVSKTDGMRGNGGYDYKLTANPDYDRLFASYQWRIYILTFHLWSFDYIVCHADDPEKDVITIKDISQFPVFVYPEIEDDVYRQVADFTRFIVQYFPERITE